MAKVDTERSKNGHPCCNTARAPPCVCLHVVMVHLRSLPFSYSAGTSSSSSRCGVVQKSGRWNIRVCCEIRLAHTLQDIRSKRTGPKSTDPPPTITKRKTKERKSKKKTLPEATRSHSPNSRKPFNNVYATPPVLPVQHSACPLAPLSTPLVEIVSTSTLTSVLLLIPKISSSLSVSGWRIF